MTNTNCPNCDRADCPTFTMPEESEWQNTREDAEAIEAAIADCNANRVDWRARAITEAARADSAEAELRVLRQYMPKWRKGQPDGLDLDTDGGKFLGFVTPKGDRWAAALNNQTELGAPKTQEAARRLVEQHHGLPPCEVLP